MLFSSSFGPARTSVSSAAPQDAGAGAERGAEVLVTTTGAGLRVREKGAMRMATWPLLRLVAAMYLVEVVKGAVPRIREGGSRFRYSCAGVAKAARGWWK